tara:strand:+ start:674 stop:1096 length:423 start_codon:yes stop_codon:yes gene_type:complete
MENNFNNLAEDLQELVLSKIIYKQNKELLDDIKNYKKNKNIIFKKYNDLGYIYNDDYTDDFNIYSKIENDLMSYYNDKYAYIDNSSINNIKKINRLLVSKYKKNIFFNFHLNFKINIKSRINRYIGCLNIDERNNFIYNI